jgi:hypothetical protein
VRFRSAAHTITNMLGATMTSRITLLLVALPALAACGPRGSIVSFTLGYDVAEQTVEGSPVGGVLGSAVDVPIPLEIDLATETAARSTGPARHVYLDELRLDVTATAEPAGDADDFDFLDRIEIFVESSRAGSALPRQRVAFLDPVPDGARSISLTLEDVDVIDYVNEGATLTSSATGRLPPDQVTFTGHIEFVVEVL